MKTINVALICALFAVITAGIGYYAGASVQKREIALVAATNLEGRVRTKNAIQTVQTATAIGLLDAAMYQDVFFLQQFDALATTDKDYPRQRDRAIKLVKENWLKYPPEYLDPESTAFIERICTQVKDCPKGDVRAKSTSFDLGLKPPSSN